jgi:hypothetical protein
MKKLFLAGALFLATGAARATTMLPPIEYDHPYDGELKFVTDLDQDTIGRMCGPKTSVACILGGGKLSYAYAAKECWIALAKQEEIDRLWIEPGNGHPPRNWSLQRLAS